MKKVININFQGRVVPIEESSFELLKQYTDSLRTYFANEQGKDEIINDIESRISELFQERLKNGSTCITDDDINTIIINMGRPQDLAAADDDHGGQQQSFSSHEAGNQAQFTSSTHSSKRLYRDENSKVLGGVCSGIAAYFNIEPLLVRLVFIFSGVGFIAYIILWAFLPASSFVQNGARKRLYRNPDDKIIAGVCSGIASYFNVNVWIPRALFLIPFITIFFRWGHFGPWNFPNFLNFSFSPGTFLIYIILWLVIPEASTTSEKLEMKGEKVDLESIKNSVVEEMKGVRDRVGKLGKEAGRFAQEKSSVIGSEVDHVVRKSRRGLGDFLVIVLKIFVYFFLTIFAFMSFGFAIAATSVFPYKDYLLTEGLQSWLAWGTLLFLIYVPVIGFITWIIRRIARARSNSRTMRFGFLILWLVGVFCFISLVISLGKDFRSVNSMVPEHISLQTPSPNKLNVIGSSNNFRNFRFQPFYAIDEDTAFVPNVSIRLTRSTSDSFEVFVSKFCNGSSRHYADTLAASMRYSVFQKDSTLYLDKGIPFTPQDKFRNQRVVVTIAIPLGKMIRINSNVSSGNWEHFQFGWNDSYEDYDWGNKEFNWGSHHNEDLVMRESGLYTLDGEPVDTQGNHTKSRRHRYRDEDNNLPQNPENQDPGVGGYRYNQNNKKADSLNELKNKEVQKLKDSIEKVKEQYDKKIEKTDNGTIHDQNAFMRFDRQGFDFVLGI